MTYIWKWPNVSKPPGTTKHKRAPEQDASHSCAGTIRRDNQNVTKLLAGAYPNDHNARKITHGRLAMGRAPVNFGACRMARSGIHPTCVITDRGVQIKTRRAANNQPSTIATGALKTKPTAPLVEAED